MLEEPTSLRIEDPGIRALFTEAVRYQAWLDVEAALALAQADLGIIPASAAEEITRKAHLSYLDLEAVRAGLARTGHPLVPLICRCQESQGCATPLAYQRAKAVAVPDGRAVPGRARDPPACFRPEVRHQGDPVPREY